MEIKLFDEKSFKIHTIKTNRFKTSKISFVFRNKMNYSNKYMYSFLSELLMDSCEKYSNRREMIIEKENLYNLSFFPRNKVVGDTLNSEFNYTFISPEYIDEEDYLENIIKFITGMILKPNIRNKEFDSKSFNILKNEILLDIDKDKEHGESIAFLNAMSLIEDKYDMVYRPFGKKEDVSNLTPEKMYQFYLDFINNSNIDIYVIGNTDTDNIVKYLKKHFVNHQIKLDNYSYYKNLSLQKKSRYIEEKNVFGQTQLLCVYNLVNLTKKEREITFKVMNYILGDGGLKSKLYQEVREKKGYCYGISSMYFEHDNLLCICSSLAKKNVKDAIKIIKKCIREMQKGLFTEEDIKDAINNIMLSINVSKNNPNYILNNYVNKYYYGAFDLEERIELFKNVTKKDIINCSKKIRNNLYYVLCEDNHE